MPFTIARTPAAQSGQVQDVTSGAVTYGHRFLTTSGRAGRAIKVRSFDEYRARLLENFVILERGERHDKIARELDAKAQRLQGRVSRTVHGDSGLLQEVPDLVEYPSVVGGTFAHRVPRAARRSADDDADSSSALLSGRGRGRQAEERVPRRDQHRARQRAHDRAQRRARRDGAAARRAVLLGSRSQDAARVANRSAVDAAVSQEARHLQGEGRADRAAGRVDRARGVRRERTGGGARGASAARLAKADLTTDMVREFTELQGTMGGIYARDDGLPEEVWKAIYFHYLPVGVEADAPPTRRRSSARRRSRGPPCRSPTSSTRSSVCSPRARSRPARAIRTACAARRRASLKILDRHAVPRSAVTALVDEAYQELRSERAGHRSAHGSSACSSFWPSARRICSSGAGIDADEDPRRRLGRLRRQPDRSLRRRGRAGAGTASRRTSMRWRVLFKRVRNITKDCRRRRATGTRSKRALTEPAEMALAAEVDAALAGRSEGARWSGQATVEALNELAKLHGPVAKFFVDVLVMTDDPQLREARLALLAIAAGYDSRTSPTSRRSPPDEQVRLKPDAACDSINTKSTERSKSGEEARNRRREEVRLFLRQRQGRRQPDDEGPARRQGRPASPR